MTTEDEMTIDERRKYLRKMKARYVKANRRKRGQLLDEMEAVVGLHRKSLIRLMRGSLERKPRQRQRSAKYGSQVTAAVQIVAESLDYPCAERLTPNLVWLAKHLAAHRELEVSEPLLAQLGEISISTVNRRLATIRQDQPRLPRRRPRPANSILRQVPMRRIPWDEQEPGHLETDLVHHCGPSASGEYVHTLQVVDVTTLWSERRAILGRSYLVVEDAFRYIVPHLPFVVREMHSDNDSVFLNHHMMRFWQGTDIGLQLSRSRPYHKNDSPFIEERNATLVRAYLGYDRLDTVAQTLAVNQLYDKLSLYHNLFQPVMRIKEKIVVSDDGQRRRIRRRYDQARTPFDRLCATDAISPQRRAELTLLRDQTNPRHLLAEIHDLLDHIFSLPCAVPGQPENVYLTLSTPPIDQEME